MQQFTWQKAACGLLLTLTAWEAFGQRGADYSSTGKPWDSSSQGFPGFFDTNMAAQGSLVLESPTFLVVVPTPSISVDYGVTPSLTVGTNALVSTLPWLIGGNGVSLKIRSLMYGTEQHQSTATVYAGFIHFDAGSTPIYSTYQIATWNHAWRPAPRHTFSSQVMYFRLGADLGTSSSINRAKGSATIGSVAGGYALRLSENWTLGVTALATLYTGIAIDTAGAAADQQSKLFGSSSTYALARFQTEWRMSDKWLMDFGLVGLGSSATGLNPLPWISLAKRW